MIYSRIAVKSKSSTQVCRIALVASLNTCVACFFGSIGNIARAQEAELPIEFACARTVLTVLDKTPSEFKKMHPDKKILECNLRISATANVDESLINRLEYTFRVPDDCLIVDYLPKTTVGSEVASINTQTSNANNQMRIKATEGGASVGFSLPVVNIEGGVSRSQADSIANSIASEVRIDVLPPKLLVMAASTFSDGRALRIKLQQRSQVTLQGDKDYVLLLEAPADFESGFIEVKCACYFRDNVIPPTGKAREIKLSVPGTRSKRDVSPKDWAAYAPAIYPLPSSVVTPTNSRVEPKKTYGVEAFDGFWLYEASTALGKYSGRAEIRKGKIKLLDGVTSYLGISCVLTGDSEKGFSVDQERTIANIGLTIAKDRFEMKFSSAETWNLKPNRLDDLTAYETLSVK